MSLPAGGAPLSSQLPFLPGQAPAACRLYSRPQLSGSQSLVPSQVATGPQRVPPRPVILLIKQPQAAEKRAQWCLWRLSLADSALALFWGVCLPPSSLQGVSAPHPWCGHLLPPPLRPGWEPEEQSAGCHCPQGEGLQKPDAEDGVIGLGDSDKRVCPESVLLPLFSRSGVSTLDPVD